MIIIYKSNYTINFTSVPSFSIAWTITNPLYLLSSSRLSAIIEKSKLDKDYDIFMAIADKVGHDKNGKVVYKRQGDGAFILDENGNKIIDDDLPLISKNYRESKDRGYTHLGFWVNSKK